MTIKFANRGTTLLVEIKGELDHHTAEHIKQKIDAELIKPTTKNVVLDLTSLTFMDSSGIGIIMGRYRNIQKLNGKMAIVSTSHQINRIIGMSGVSKVIPVYDSLNDAINKM